MSDAVNLHNLVTLRGGPYDGQQVPEPSGRWTPLLLEGDEIPEGMVARYKATRDSRVWRFDGYDKIVAKLPAPGASA